MPTAPASPSPARPADAGGVVAGRRGLHRRRRHAGIRPRASRTGRYTYIQKGSATASIQVRAMDDSANIGAPATRELSSYRPVQRLRRAGPRRRRIPRTAARYELGLNVHADAWTASSPACASTRAPATPGPTPGRCGAPPASGWPRRRSRNETASGWQTVLFSQPVAGHRRARNTPSPTRPRNGHYASKDSSGPALA